jgi:hypothetical protein
MFGAWRSNQGLKCGRDASVRQSPLKVETKPCSAIGPAAATTKNIRPNPASCCATLLQHPVPELSARCPPGWLFINVLAKHWLPRRGAMEGKQYTANLPGCPRAGAVDGGSSDSFPRLGLHSSRSRSMRLDDCFSLSDTTKRCVRSWCHPPRPFMNLPGPLSKVTVPTPWVRPAGLHLFLPPTYMMSSPFIGRPVLLGPLQSPRPVFVKVFPPSRVVQKPPKLGLGSAEHHQGRVVNAECRSSLFLESWPWIDELSKPVVMEIVRNACARRRPSTAVPARRPGRSAKLAPSRPVQRCNLQA